MPKGSFWLSSSTVDFNPIERSLRMKQPIVTIIAISSLIGFGVAQDRLTDIYGRTAFGELKGLEGQHILFQQSDQPGITRFLVSTVSMITLEDGRRYELPSDAVKLYQDFQEDIPPELAELSTEKREERPEYFTEGKFQAMKDYGGNDALGWGLLVGLSGGPFGWGLGYLIVSGQSGDIPRKYIPYLNHLEQQEIMDFSDGYISYVADRRKYKFNLGAGMGTAFLVILYLFR